MSTTNGSNGSNGNANATATNAPTFLSLDDLFGPRRAILHDFPTRGETRTFYYTPLTHNENTEIYRKLYALRNAEDEERVTALSEQLTYYADLLASHLVKSQTDNSPLLTREAASRLDMNTMKLLAEAMGRQGEKVREEMGEDSELSGQKENGSDGSSDAPIVGESGTSPVS